MGSIVLGCLFEPRVDALLDCMAVIKQRGIIEEVVELGMSSLVQPIPRSVWVPWTCPRHMETYVLRIQSSTRMPLCTSICVSSHMLICLSIYASLHMFWYTYAVAHVIVHVLVQAVYMSIYMSLCVSFYMPDIVMAYVGMPYIVMAPYSYGPYSYGIYS